MPRCEQGSIAALAFSKYSGLLASGGKDRTVRLWKVSSGKQFALLKGHKAPVLAVHSSDDGRSVTFIDSNGVVNVWRRSK